MPPFGTDQAVRLFMKGAHIMMFDKLREIIGDYQQLNFARRAIELPLHCADALDSDGLGKEYWQTAPLPEPLNSPGGQGSGPVAAPDPRRAAWEQRVRPPTTTFSCTANANPGSHAAPCTISSIDAIAQRCVWRRGRAAQDAHAERRSSNEMPQWHRSSWHRSSPLEA